MIIRTFKIQKIVSERHLRSLIKEKHLKYFLVTGPLLLITVFNLETIIKNGFSYKNQNIFLIEN
jgi:hypothetical protein